MYSHSKKRLGRFYVIVLFALILTGMIVFPVKSYSREKAGSGVVLKPAFSFYLNLKEGKYARAWSFLTPVSKEAIIDKIQSFYAKSKIKIKKSRILYNLKTGGRIAKYFWNGYTRSFNPDAVLKYSVWKIKSVGEKKALIEIDYKYGKAPAYFKIYKINGSWKFGLIESLYSRILMKKMANGVFNRF